MDEVLLSVSHLNVVFNGHKVLSDISFDVARDETLAVIGPNGAGKTVLFRAILGLIPFEGKVSWGSGVKIGYVPQKLFVARDIPLTVEEFLRFKEKRENKISEALEGVGFPSRLLKRKLGVLSGGEIQRVLIAYGLLGEPNVLLFDEPTSGIDVSGEETVYALIDKLQKKRDLAIIFISHELEVVYKYAENVLCLNKEKICFGAPHEAIDKESLQRLYGEDVHFYRHDHHH